VAIALGLHLRSAGLPGGRRPNEPDRKLELRSK
jgi:hypothetical protein